MPTRYRHPVLVSSTDGVGTKALIAQATGRFDTIGIDLVAMCVDDIVCPGAEPLFFLDYIAVGRLDPDQIEQLVEGVAEGCRQAGCALVGGEMAEHPGAMEPGEFDLVGFAVGVVERDRLITGEHVAAGDVLIGLPSPGLRSNGYSLARRVLLERAGRSLDEPAWTGAPHSLADELLVPSVIYAPAVARPAPRHVDVRAVAHVTGGGLRGNVPRVLPDGRRRGARPSGVGGAADLRRDPAAGRGEPTTRWRGVQPRHRHGRRGSRRRCPAGDRPAARPGPPGHPDRRDRLRPGGRPRMKVLIVDDEPDILLMLRVNLEAEGYQTALAADGETALRRIAEEQPDLVLLDVMMPVMDGWSVLEALARDVFDHRVIVVSAKSSERDGRVPYALGASVYLTKPFDPDELIKEVGRVLSSTPAQLEEQRQNLMTRVTGGAGS